jgi:hypothetical protein
VRIVINYMKATTGGPNDIPRITLNWAGVSVTAALAAIGRNLASSIIQIVDPPKFAFVSSLAAAAIASGYGVASNNNALAYTTTTSEVYYSNTPGTKTTGSGALPTELMLAPRQTFSATCGAYNIVVIPEAG